MAFVVTDNCQACRFTECVTVCPVSCFHGDGQMLYIDPQLCIECGACIDACPVSAIYDESDLPAEKMHWKAVNQEKSGDLPIVDTHQAPLPGALARKAELGR